MKQDKQTVIDYMKQKYYKCSEKTIKYVVDEWFNILEPKNDESEITLCDEIKIQKLINIVWNEHNNNLKGGENMKYYVIYDGKDVGWYKTRYKVICIVTDEAIAKDFCEKWGCRYLTEEVGKPSTKFNHMSVWEPNKEED